MLMLSPALPCPSLPCSTLAETARCRNVWGRNILMPKRLVAETSMDRNVFGAVLLPYSFDHHCTFIQKEHGGEAKQDVKLCNTVLAFTHSEPVH